jgi:hypothetical protein
VGIPVARLSSAATLQEAVVRRPATPCGQVDTCRFTEHFEHICTSQREYRSVGPLKLLRAPHREAGSFCTPPARGVSIRMNRSRRDGTKTVDQGAGRFSGLLDRHYTVAPANLVCTCELSSEIDFLAVEFSPEAFKEHLGTVTISADFTPGTRRTSWSCNSLNACGEKVSKG